MFLEVFGWQLGHSFKQTYGCDQFQTLVGCLGLFKLQQDLLDCVQYLMVSLLHTQNYRLIPIYVREVIIISNVLELHIVKYREQDLEQILTPVSLKLVPIPGKEWHGLYVCDI